MSTFRTKDAFVWIFLCQNFKKTIAIFEIRILEFVRNEILTHIVISGIVTTFSEGLLVVPSILLIGAC